MTAKNKTEWRNNLLYVVSLLSGLQLTENVKGQLGLALLWPRPGRRSVQPGRRPAGGATGPRLLSGTTAAGQKKFKS